MAEYNRMRGLLGFPVDYKMGHALQRHGEIRSHALFDAVKAHVVKLVAKDANGTACGFFNGFFYHDTEPLIITTGHFVGFNGAMQYVLTLFDGTILSQEHALILVKRSLFTDVAVFKCEQRLPHPPISSSIRASEAQRVVIVGFKGRSDPQLTFNDGSVSHVSEFAGTFTTSAYADKGFSGAPVFSMDGYFVGMVKGGEGEDIRQPVCISATAIHFALIAPPDPLPDLH